MSVILKELKNQYIFAKVLSTQFVPHDGYFLILNGLAIPHLDIDTRNDDYVIIKFKDTCGMHFKNDPGFTIKGIYAKTDSVHSTIKCRLYSHLEDIC